MRTIKFRGKRVDNGEWVYGYYTKHSDKESGVLGVENDYFWITDKNGDIDDVFADSVGQFTGLFDKNGKEIYEGDILHFGDLTIIYCVIWNDCGFKAYQVGSNRVEYTPSNSITMYKIGNIHDNKELLND